VKLERRHCFGHPIRSDPQGNRPWLSDWGPSLEHIHGNSELPKNGEDLGNLPLVINADHDERGPSSCHAASKIFPLVARI
jgi:hypothetical protein